MKARHVLLVLAILGVLMMAFLLGVVPTRYPRMVSPVSLHWPFKGWSYIWATPAAPEAEAAEPAPAERVVETVVVEKEVVVTKEVEKVVTKEVEKIVEVTPTPAADAAPTTSEITWYCSQAGGAPKVNIAGKEYPCLEREAPRNTSVRPAAPITHASSTAAISGEMFEAWGVPESANLQDRAIVVGSQAEVDALIAQGKFATTFGNGMEAYRGSPGCYNFTAGDGNEPPIDVMKASEGCIQAYNELNRNVLDNLDAEQWGVPEGSFTGFHGATVLVQCEDGFSVKLHGAKFQNWSFYMRAYYPDATTPENRDHFCTYSEYVPDAAWTEKIGNGRGGFLNGDSMESAVDISLSKSNDGDAGTLTHYEGFYDSNTRGFGVWKKARGDANWQLVFKNY